MSDKRYETSLANAIVYSATLKADDPRFLTAVEVKQHDGSMWYLRNAFWMPDPQDNQWVWIITEHFGEQVHDSADVTLRVFEGPSHDYLRRDVDDGGISNPPLVECHMTDCNGHYYMDGFNRDKTRAFLMCDTCKACYFAPVEKSKL